MTMTDKQAYDNKVLTLIVDCTAQTTSSMAPLLAHDFGDQDGRDLENSLKRLKSKEFVSFSKLSKQWNALEAGIGFRSTLSAPAVEGVEVSAGNQIAEAADAGATQENNMEKQESAEASVGDIDAAIKSAKEKKGTKPAKEATETKRPRLTDEEKKARDEQRAKERAEAKAKRDEVRAAKKQEKELAKQPAHMSKVSKAAERLPELDETALNLFNEATVNLSASGLAALAAHIQHFNRTKATERALTQKVGEGDTVKVISGDPRYIGKTGEVTKVQRIRCYVNVDPSKKPIYLFTSDVEVVKASPVKTAANA